MIRSPLIAALLLFAVPALQAQTKKTTTPDKPAKTEKTTPTAEKKEAAKEKPAAKPAKPDGTVDPVDQALLDHANKELNQLSPAQTTSLLKLINDGAPEDLQTMPGIGETKAAAIKKARPFKTGDQLIMVDGIGEGTFDGIVKWVKDGMPKEAPAAKPAAKTEEKPKTKPTPKAAEKPAAKPSAKPATKAEDKPAPVKK